MNVTGDRTVEHGLATIGFDDDGVAGQSWDLISDGILTGYQLDRVFARRLGLDRSNGCAHADSPAHIPIQRMANVSLQPDPDGGTADDLIAGVDDGIYVVGDKSWSIDMQRYNFQFTGQRFYRINNGELAGQVRDVAYQATTTDFWGAMDAVGGPQTYLLGGAFNCGKGQPGQVGGGLARLPGGTVPRHQHPQHRAGGRGMTAAAPSTAPADRRARPNLAPHPAADHRRRAGRIERRRLHRRRAVRHRGECALGQQHRHHQRARQPLSWFVVCGRRAAQPAPSPLPRRPRGSADDVGAVVRQSHEAARAAAASGRAQDAMPLSTPRQAPRSTATSATRRQRRRSRSSAN